MSVQEGGLASRREYSAVAWSWVAVAPVNE